MGFFSGEDKPVRKPKPRTVWQELTGAPVEYEEEQKPQGFLDWLFGTNRAEVQARDAKVQAEWRRKRQEQHVREGRHPDGSPRMSAGTAWGLDRINEKYGYDGWSRGSYSKQVQEDDERYKEGFF
jgi:hypothetical protein